MTGSGSACFGVFADAAGGAAAALHLKEEVIDDPQPSGDKPQESVKMTWTFDDHLKAINSPVLKVSE